MKKRTVKQTRVISLLLAVMMIVTSLPFAGISALAATSDDFEYEILDDDTAEITGYTGSAETLEIPSTLDGYTVTSIGNYAFSSCESLKSITIPDGVTSIGEGAFALCRSLTSITIPNSVTSIGDGVFDFSAIDRIYGYENSYAQSYAEENGYKFVVFNDFVNEESRDFNYEILDDGTAEITGYTGEAETLEIPSTLDGYTVTSIGNYAFDECYLTSITIPNSITNIGDNAFEDCHSLTSVTIPNSVTSIGAWAFAWCDSLTSIAIPDSVTIIGDWAFYACDSLTSITVDENNKAYSSQDGVLFNKEKTELAQYPAGNKRTTYSIPDSVTSIGNGAFEDCHSLTSVTIPDSVTSIGVEAFYWCNSLTSITIPDSVTSIGDKAFESCDSLTSIAIPDSVTSIGEYAFCYCYSLTSVDLGNGVTSIGDEAFYECNSLTSIAIPDSVTSIGYYAFVNCDRLKSITVDENNKNYSSQDGVLFNKEKTELIQYPIGNESTSYSIPNSVTRIGAEAFENCDSLSSITIPDSVTSIGSWAFGYCDSLTSVKIPNSVISVGACAFADCYSLTSVTIPDSVTSIGASAFSGTGYYNDDTNWENGVLYIGNHLIDANNDEHGEVPSEYSINEGTLTIAGGAFELCKNLTNITIPDSVTSIGNGAFENCDSLTSIAIPDSVTSIGQGTFADCDSLTSIAIPDSVTSIGSYAFDYTGYYNDDTNWEDGVLYIGNHLVAANYDEIPAEYSIKEGTVTIAGAVFSDCDNLTSITIPDSVTSIGQGTFSYCYSLTSVTIPDSVTSIGDAAFYGCNSLTSITIPDSVTNIGDNAFEDSALETIYGYENSYAQTYAKENGYEFVSLGSVETGTLGDVNGDGNIDPLDVLIVKRYIAEFDDAKLEGDAFARADVSGDGKVDPLDVLFIMQKIAEIIDSFDEIKQK